MPERSFTRGQQFLLPPSLDEWTPADHAVRFVDVFVDQLPVEVARALGLTDAPDGMGAPRYAPGVLARVWVYGFMTGIRSSRALERACHDQISMRWLTSNQTPDHNTLWRWYAEHRAAMRALFRQTVTTAVGAGLIDLALMAVDGTKLRANAAADRSLTADDLHKLLAETEVAIAALEAQNEGGDDPPPPHLPPELRSAEALQARIAGALAACADRAEATGASASTSAPRGNVTDPDARWMKLRTGVVPGYNAQAAVVTTSRAARRILGDEAAGGRFMVAAQVTTNATDVHELGPVVREAVATMAQKPTLTVADAGYFSGAALAEAAAVDVVVVMPEPTEDDQRGPFHRDAFIYDSETDRLQCPEGHWLRFVRHSRSESGEPQRVYGGLGKVCNACPAYRTCTTAKRDGRTVKLSIHDAHIQAQRRTRREPAQQQALKRRARLIEPVFGILKTVLGGGRTLVRGRERVEAEWLLLCMAFNLRTLHRIWRALPPDQRSQLVGGEFRAIGSP